MNNKVKTKWERQFISWKVVQQQGSTVRCVNSSGGNGLQQSIWEHELTVVAALSVHTTIHKKWDLTKCSNLTGITLLLVPCKVRAKYVLKVLLNIGWMMILTSLFRQQQAGFLIEHWFCYLFFQANNRETSNLWKVKSLERPLLVIS